MNEPLVGVQIVLKKKEHVLPCAFTMKQNLNIETCVFICSFLLCLGILTILPLFTRSKPLFSEKSVISQGIFFFQCIDDNSEKG